LIFSPLVNFEIWHYIIGMKRSYLFIVVLLLSGMTVSAQGVDMSFYTEELNNSETTVYGMVDILRAVKEGNFTGIGEFYDNAIKVYLHRLQNHTSNQDRVAVEEAARLILRGLAAEKHAESAPQVWQLIQYFDIANQLNDGYLMYEAVVAMAEMGAKNYAPHIAIYLESYNERYNADLNFKSKMHLVMPGLVTALETFGDAVGVRPVFFASIGWYDSDRREIASNALVNIMNGLGDVIGHIIGEIITDHYNSPGIKYAAWQQLLRTQSPNETKARVAVSALEASYSFVGTSRETQNILKEMRTSAIQTIRELGIADDSVYPFLERTYREAFETGSTDMETIVLVVRTLTAAKTDEAVALMTEFLRGLHSRRRSGPWGNIERDIMNIIIPALASTGTQSQTTIQLLTMISRSSMYTGAEQGWARNALTQLNASGR